MAVDWNAWHREYDDPESRLSLRLTAVQGFLREALDRAPPGPIRAISVCAGEGRDLLGVLASHPRAGDVSARLVELDPELVAQARSAARPGVEIVCGDASATDAYRGAVPADLVLVCGVFGNVSDADVERTVAFLPSLCAPGATVFWTRHCRPPDLTVDIRRWFAESGFDEAGFVTSGEHFYGVGAHRLTGPARAFAPGERMFDFVGADVLARRSPPERKRAARMTAAYDVMAPVHEPPDRDAALATLRREDPVRWDAENDWWLVTRHADVREVSRRPELFSSEPRGPWHVFEYHFSMQAMDGEPHRRHRKVVSHAFTPRIVALLSERAQRYADEAIDALGDRRAGEFVTDLAVPVPLRIIADMLGVADADLDEFRAWSDAMVLAGGGHGDGAELTEASSLLGDFLAYLTEAVERRRAEPRDDLLSHILQAAESGVLEGAERFHLESDEVRDFALFLLVAGNETTRNAISQGMLALLQHPDERARLAAEPLLWETATEEILRWTSPVRAMRRVALRDTELGGRKIHEGQSVVMVYASANRDESVFDEPHRFRVDRHPNEHLALGFGPHYCLGANLARMEIRTVLRRVLERLPELRLAPGGGAVQTPSALIDGLDALPVEW